MKDFFSILVLVVILNLHLLGQKKNLPISETNRTDKDIYLKLNDELTKKNISGLEEFVYQKFPFLNETQSKLKVAFKVESPYGLHILFHQYFKDFQVYNAGIKFNLDKNYRVLNALNYLQTFEPKIYGNFSFDVLSFINPQRLRLQSNNEFDIYYSKVLFNVQGKLRYAYQVQTQMDNEYSSQEWILDGETGSILHHQVLAAFRTQQDTSGKGYVFVPDPLTRAGVTYGSPYVDNNDADVTVINQQRDTVSLKNITFSNGSFKLEGPFVKITEFESPIVQPVTSSDGNFYFGRASNGFEDVNAYFHIDSMQRYIQSLGFNNLANFQILVDAHSNFGQDNSYYTSSPSPRLAFGEGGVDDAEDADVIVHEYGHALSASGSPGSNSGNQRQGQDEGIGDYIAASYSRSINPFNWFDIFNWDGHNTFWDGRKCNITTKYPNITGNFYNYGELWCTVLMQVWGNIGKIASDKVFFQHLYMNAANQSLKDAAELILDADTLIYGGTNSIAYLQAFCDYQLITDSRCTLASNAHIFSEHLFNIFPNPASQFLTIQNINHFERTKVMIFNSLGQVIFENEYPNFDEQLINLQNVPNGIYFIQMSSGNKFFSQKIVVQK